MSSSPDTDRLADVQVSVDIDAPADVVFQSLVEPDALGEWFRAPDGAATHGWDVDARPGGAWRALTANGGVLSGRFTDVEPSRRLGFTWRNEDGDASHVRYELEPIRVAGDEWTRLTVTHTPSPRLHLGGNPPAGSAGGIISAHAVSIWRARLSTLERWMLRHSCLIV